MSHDKHHDSKHHDSKHHDQKHHEKSAKPAVDKSFGTNDTGAEEEKEWIDGLSDDE